MVRANYNNLVKGIHETTEFLELFLRNLLCDEQNELHNRSMHVSGIYKDYQKANIKDEKADIETEKADIETKKADIETGKADVGTEKANIDILRMYSDALKDFTPKTVEHVQKMFASFGSESVFGRSDVQSITLLGHTRASELLKELIEAEMIEAVSSHGKGKYKFCDK